jgi:hypothetical protein
MSMMPRTLLPLFLILAAAPGRADTFRVRNTNDSGANSFRWAIDQANTHVGRDKILFAPAMAGKTILPTSKLPAVTDAQTIINGDIDGDGAPDVGLNGRLISTAPGLQLQANRCTVAGLAVTNFTAYGVMLMGASRCTVRSCHLGVNLAGTTRRPNVLAQVLLYQANSNLIGGPLPTDRNIIAGGGKDQHAGIRISDSNDNTVIGNYFGIKRDGSTVLNLWDPSVGDFGVFLEADSADCTGNAVGGTEAGEANVFAGLGVGVYMEGASDNTVEGNLFGLAPDGSKLVAFLLAGVCATQGAHHNRIGGTATGARNVFAGCENAGVGFTGAATASNRVQGNYFGMNAAGTRTRRNGTGVDITADAGRNIIGGGTEAAGNYFTHHDPDDQGMGIRIGYAGAGSLVAHNVLGVLPNGRAAPAPKWDAIFVGDVRATVINNRIGYARRGIWAYSGSADARVFGNRFHHCEDAVLISGDARANLGNLGNSRTDDDGGNYFRTTNDCHIRNLTPFVVKAEGNNFGTTSRSQINAKIHDRRDDGSLGRVDFAPLMGGVMPTGTTEGVLTIASATACPTAQGAQVTFSLSAPATVSATVRNIAGRPIRTLCVGKQSEAGPNVLLWNAQSDSGLPVPNGVYLVDIRAAAPNGTQARRLAQVRLNR